MKKYLPYITYLALSLFLLSSNLSFALSYGVTGQADDGTKRILICTSAGVKWVSLDDISADNSQLSSNKIFHHCPLCCISSAGIDIDYIQALPSLYINPPLSLSNRYALTFELAKPFYYYQPSHPRAPPQV